MRNSGILAFLGGAVAGAAVALLLAPRRGDETRHMIKEYVDHKMRRCHCGENGHHHDHDCHCDEQLPVPTEPK